MQLNLETLTPPIGATSMRKTLVLIEILQLISVPLHLMIQQVFIDFLDDY